MFDSRLYVGLAGIVLGPDIHVGLSPHLHPYPNFTYFYVLLIVEQIVYRLLKYTKFKINKLYTVLYLTTVAYKLFHKQCILSKPLKLVTRLERKQQGD